MTEKLVIGLLVFSVIGLVGGVQDVEAISFNTPITFTNPEVDPDDFFQDFFGGWVAIRPGHVAILLSIGSGGS